MEKRTVFDYQSTKKPGELDVAIKVGAKNIMSGFSLDSESPAEVKRLIDNLKKLFTHPDLSHATFFLSEKDRTSKLGQALKETFEGVQA